MLDACATSCGTCEEKRTACDRPVEVALAPMPQQLQSCLAMGYLSCTGSASSPSVFAAPHAWATKLQKAAYMCPTHE
eukprot:5048180-Pleurochrysis_carterae.AAC.4